MKKISAFLAAVLLLTSLTACSSKQEESSVPAGTAVEVKTVQRADIATEDTVTGMVSANRNMPVMPPVSCKIKEVHVKAGETVKKGDKLFTLDTADIRDLYGTLLNTYSSTKALLDEQIRQTEQTYENLQALYEMGAVSQSQLDQTKLGLMQAKSSRDSTLAQLGVKDVMDALADPTVRAPIDGTVSNISATAGVIAANSSPALIVSEIGHPQLTVSVSEVLQPFLRVGDPVTVTIPSLDDAEVEGTIFSVASVVSQSNALYEVRIDLPETLEVSVGMFARAHFSTNSRANTVVVPTEAILTREDAQFVYIVEGSTAYRVEVTTGLIGETETEILTGLNGGEQLVTRGQSYLSDGAPVRITEGGAA